MRISNIEKLPDVAQRREWSKILNCDYATLQRAEMRGEIHRIQRKGKGVPLFSKTTILNWLGVAK